LGLNQHIPLINAGLGQARTPQGLDCGEGVAGTVGNTFRRWVAFQAA